MKKINVLLFTMTLALGGFAANRPIQAAFENEQANETLWVKVGKEFTIDLTSYMNEGYAWMMDHNEDIICLYSETIPSPIPGKKGTERLHFRCDKPGNFRMSVEDFSMHGKYPRAILYYNIIAR